MSTEVTLRSEEGKTQAATGAWQAYDASSRGARAVGFAVAGVVCAVPFVFVPVLHLITTWLLPVLGLVAAANAWLTTEKLTEVQGPCPSCDQPITLDGGRYTPQMHDSCPACSRLVFMDVTGTVNA